MYKIFQDALSSSISTFLPVLIALIGLYGNKIQEKENILVKNRIKKKEKLNKNFHEISKQMEIFQNKIEKEKWQSIDLTQIVKEFNAINSSIELEFSEITLKKEEKGLEKKDITDYLKDFKDKKINEDINDYEEIVLNYLIHLDMVQKAIIDLGRNQFNPIFKEDERQKKNESLIIWKILFKITNSYQSLIISQEEAIIRDFKLSLFKKRQKSLNFNKSNYEMLMKITNREIDTRIAQYKENINQKKDKNGDRIKLSKVSEAEIDKEFTELSDKMLELSVHEIIERGIRIIDKHFSETIPTTFRSTASGNRYLYSKTSPIHPSDNDFFNPKEFNTKENNYFIETNCNKKDALKYIERLKNFMFENYTVKKED